MAVVPVWKVKDATGKYQASCKEVEAAAALASFYGPGATIWYDHKLRVWTEGEDGQAGVSYDAVVDVATERRDEWQQANADKLRAKMTN